MIRGLDTFRNHFSGMEEHYVLIGGAACELHLSQTPFLFRATHDLDIVLCLEALSEPFGEKLWDFLHRGGYQIQGKSDGKKHFYRFRHPASPEYPAMLELFTRIPEVFRGRDLQELTPLPLSGEISSLSAILLDDDYYSLILHNRTVLNGLSVLTPEALIVLKAKAWMDLSARRAKGESIDAREVKKHRNDILRLSALLSSDNSLVLPHTIAREMADFLQCLTIDGHDLTALGILGSPDEIHDMLSALLQP